MKKLVWNTAVLTLLISGMSQAWAGPLFTFTFSGSGISGSGTLTVTDNGSGSFTATGGSGTVIGITPTSGTPYTPFTLLPNRVVPSTTLSPSGIFQYDNQLFPGQASLLNSNGLLFLFDTSNIEAKIFSNGAGTPYIYSDSSGFRAPVHFALIHNSEPVTIHNPEPATWLFFATGLCGLLGYGWRKRRQAA